MATPVTTPMYVLTVASFGIFDDVKFRPGRKRLAGAISVCNTPKRVVMSRIGPHPRLVVARAATYGTVPENETLDGGKLASDRRIGPSS